MSTNKREVTLRFLAQPTDANFGGNVHGGSAMKWLDQAGYACATAWSRRYCVTAFVGNINFLNPISVGHLVELNAQVIYTGKTSMYIAVDLLSGDTKGSKLSKAMHCIMVFVAVDKDGHSVEVPSWTPTNDADIRMEKYALKLIALRKANKEGLDEILR